MIIGIGTDIIEIARIEKSMKAEAFMHKAFTEMEKVYFEKRQHKAETIAGVFAAKEAVSKALGTGFRTIAVRDIEITPNTLGKPEVTLYDGAKQLAAQLGIHKIHVTISHCKEYAVAYVVVEGSTIYEVNDTGTDERTR